MVDTADLLKLYVCECQSDQLPLKALQMFHAFNLYGDVIRFHANKLNLRIDNSGPLRLWGDTRPHLSIAPGIILNTIH